MIKLPTSSSYPEYYKRPSKMAKSVSPSRSELSTSESSIDDSQNSMPEPTNSVFNPLPLGSITNKLHTKQSYDFASVYNTVTNCINQNYYNTSTLNQNHYENYPNGTGGSALSCNASAMNLPTSMQPQKSSGFLLNNLNHHQNAHYYPNQFQSMQPTSVRLNNDNRNSTGSSADSSLNSPVSVTIDSNSPGQIGQNFASFSDLQNQHSRSNFYSNLATQSNLKSLSTQNNFSSVIPNGNAGSAVTDSSLLLRINPNEHSSSSIPPAKKRRPVPVENKDPLYWEKRRKNNESAKRSRDIRRSKEEHISVRVVYLEQENLQLRTEVALLRSETEKSRSLLASCSNSNN
jgi:hypothetical protein